MPDDLGSILDRLWKTAIDQSAVSVAFLDDGMAACRELPVGDDPSIPHYWDAVSAVDVVMLTMQALRGDMIDQWLKVAKCGIGRTDQALWRRMASQIKGGIPPDEVAEMNHRIATHPMMGREYAWQEQMIRFVEEHLALDEESLEQLRHLALQT
jgi:hypothetical protein